MFKFILFFIQEWKGYTNFQAFWEKRQDTYTKLNNREERPYKGRFDYALTNAKIFYKHRDRYGRKCQKANGDCSKCRAKHC